MKCMFCGSVLDVFDSEKCFCSNCNKYFFMTEEFKKSKENNKDSIVENNTDDLVIDDSELPPSNMLDFFEHRGYIDNRAIYKINDNYNKINSIENIDDIRRQKIKEIEEYIRNNPDEPKQERVDDFQVKVFNVFALIIAFIGLKYYPLPLLSIIASIIALIKAKKIIPSYSGGIFFSIATMIISAFLLLISGYLDTFQNF